MNRAAISKNARLGMSTVAIGEVIKVLLSWQAGRELKLETLNSFFDWLEKGAEIHNINNTVHEIAAKLRSLNDRLGIPDSLNLATALDKKAHIFYCVDNDFHSSERVVNHCKENNLKIKNVSELT